MNPVNFPTLDVHLPSGRVVTIREQTGEDEDVLSRVRDAASNLGIHKFLSRIIVNPVTTPNDLEHWKVRDKYYLLYKSRIFSLGDKVIFTHSFKPTSSSQLSLISRDIEEDLKIFDWDFSKGNPPKRGEEGYDPKRVAGYYEDSEWHEFTIPSGKVCKFKYLTGVEEKKALGIDRDDFSINLKLTLRHFHLQMEGNWYPIERFDMFTSRESAAIRKELETYDPEFDLMVTLNHPDPNGRAEQISLMALDSFFFPTE